LFTKGYPYLEFLADIAGGVGKTPGIPLNSKTDNKEIRKVTKII